MERVYNFKFYHCHEIILNIKKMRSKKTIFIVVITAVIVYFGYNQIKEAYEKIKLKLNIK